MVKLSQALKDAITQMGEKYVSTELTEKQVEAMLKAADYDHIWQEKPDLKITKPALALPFVLIDNPFSEPEDNIPYEKKSFLTEQEKWGFIKHETANGWVADKDKNGNIVLKYTWKELTQIHDSVVIGPDPDPKDEGVQLAAKVVEPPAGWGVGSLPTLGPGMIEIDKSILHQEWILTIKKDGAAYASAVKFDVMEGWLANMGLDTKKVDVAEYLITLFHNVQKHFINHGALELMDLYLNTLMQIGAKK